MKNDLCIMGLVFLLHITSGMPRPQRHRSYIFLEVTDSPISNGDEIVLEGNFTGRFVVTRFISRSSSCHGGILPGSRGRTQCQPLILTFHVNLGLLRASYLGKEEVARSVVIGSVVHRNIRPNHFFRILIKVGRSNYTIMFDGEHLLTVGDRIGHGDIIHLRSYGWHLTQYSVIHKNRPNVAPTCGIQRGLVAGTTRIVGGSNAKGGEFPWQAAIRQKFVLPWSDILHVCGATLIRSCWVITAGHCVETLTARKSLYSVRVGDYFNGNSKIYSSEEDQQDLEIGQLIRHPEYSLSPTPTNDIALIRLRETAPGICAKLSDFVQPICLPVLGDIFPTNSACTVTGWGAIRWIGGASYPHILQKGKVRIHDHDTCKKWYGLIQGKHKVHSKTVCAAGKGLDTCLGDSGGPLVCPKPRGTSGSSYTLWGVTSWGEGCAVGERPGVYMKVIDYLDWIYRQIGE